MKLVSALLFAVLPFCAWSAEKRDCGPIPPGGQFDEKCNLSVVSAPLSYFKGLELYSWSEDGKWFFSLLPGLNGLQKWDDILKSKIEGSQELKKRLNGLPSGTEIFWNIRAVPGLKLRYPPKAIAQEISQACGQRHVQLIMPLLP